MPRSRETVSEVPQKKVPFQLSLRSSSSESDPLHQRPMVDRSPKTGGRRSPRGSQSDSLSQKKLGTRVADLESELGLAQEELKKLKDQLVSTEAAKRKAQEELELKKHKLPVPENEEERDGKFELAPAPPQPSEIQETNQIVIINSTGSDDENSCETDVFEVPMDMVPDKTLMQVSNMNEKEDDNKSEPLEISSEPEVEKPSLLDMTLFKDEINSLKAKLEEKDKEVELLQIDNSNLNKKMTELEAKVASSRLKEEREQKLTQTEVELESSKVNVAHLSQELEIVGKAKEALESEMKTLRVQTEQWRKAADAAAAVLSGGMDMNGNFAGRCGSMDQHVVSGDVFELAGAYSGYEGPLMADDLDDRYGNGKRKGSGIRIFGDLWKKKGQK